MTQEISIEEIVRLNAMLTALNQNMDSVQQTNDAVLKRLVKLDEVNKELVRALEDIAEYGSSGLCGSDAHRMMKIATEALTKAGAL